MATMQGYSLLEGLIVVALIATMLSFAIAYRVDSIEQRRLDMELEERYRKAKNILIYARNLHAQGLRHSGGLKAAQLQAMARSTQWESAADQISAIVSDGYEDDFVMGFYEGNVAIKFFIDDRMSLHNYPLHREIMVGDQDMAVLLKVLPVVRSRILRFHDYLSN